MTDNDPKRLTAEQRELLLGMVDDFREIGPAVKPEARAVRAALAEIDALTLCLDEEAKRAFQAEERRTALANERDALRAEVEQFNTRFPLIDAHTETKAREAIGEIRRVRDDLPGGGYRKKTYVDANRAFQQVEYWIARARDADALRALVAEMREALTFYANPETYFAITFLDDPPSGDFMEDFSDDHGGEFDRPMPGKRARAALAKEKK